MSVRDVIQAAAGAAGTVDKTFVEDVFQTFLYTGNGSTQTITNGIDLAGKGGMVWVKDRTIVKNHNIYDTVRGVSKWINSDGTSAQLDFAPYGVNSFNSNGFQVNDTSTGTYGINKTGDSYVSWTFRKAPKFFDVVTYTGNGAGIRAIPHSLGIAPGLTILKKTSTTSNWIVDDPSGIMGIYGQPLYLNTTAAKDAFNQTGIFSATATSFYVGSTSGSPNFGSNDAGVQYVAYLFAHDTTTDGLIQCGSYTGTGSAGLFVDLGWEPQYVMIKAASATGSWWITDSMRGFTSNGPGVATSAYLQANASSAESTYAVASNATGFTIQTTGTSINASGQTYIYMAIRRGPMKTPTDGTKVFAPDAYNEVSNPPGIGKRTYGFAPDMVMHTRRSGGYSYYVWDKLRGLNNANLITAQTASEGSYLGEYPWGGFDNTGVTPGFLFNNNPPDKASLFAFKRAPGFFDVVCYTGNGSVRTINHNLGVAPELMIVKNRSGGWAWLVYSQATGNNAYLRLDATAAVATGASNTWGQTTPTPSAFTVGADPSVNFNGQNIVAYLFASCPGVSKVGSYTGNGSSQTINCGFTNGARFFLVKATSTTGNWWVYDSARGIVSSTDPVLALNSTAAEVTSADAVDPDSSGIIVNQEATCSINASGVSYIYLAIA